MKSAVMYGIGDIRMEETPRPVPAGNEVLVKVKAIGICGGDMHFYHGTHPYSNYPRVYGHELSGEIVETGSGVTERKVGERVVLEPTIPCGKCYPCRIGKYNCCVDLKIIGVHTDGGFAEYVAAPEEKVFPIPDSLPYDIAALAEPYSIGAQAVNRAGITGQDRCAIIGAGAIGLTILDIAKSRGAQVMIADLHPYRLELARKLGADVVVNSGEEDLTEKIMEFTDGEGAGVVVEATGVPKIAEMTVGLVANGGRIVIVGVLNQDVCFPGIKFTNKEMTILGSRNSAGVFPYVIEGFAHGTLHPEIIMTKKFKLDDTVDAFKYMETHLNEVGKIVLEMD